MKMTKEHYLSLRSGVRSVMAQFPHSDYPELSEERYRWDCLHMAQIQFPELKDLVQRDLYAYLNDSNIDTALRKIAQ